MLIGTNFQNSVVEINMVTMATNGQLNPVGVTFGSFGPIHKQKKLGIIQKMHVSDNGAFLAVLDEHF